MNMTRVPVRRERPTVAAWSLALLVTMLMVYVLTLNRAMPEVAQTVSAAPNVTRPLALEPFRVYIVSMGDYDDGGRARVEAAGCASSGAAGFVTEVDGRWHVFGALYGSERDARRAASKLSQAGSGATVIALEAEGLTLRVTAPERQIDAIAAAEAALRDQLDQLGTLARQLDRGEIEPDGAQTLCAMSATALDDARKALDGMPGASDNVLCAGLIEHIGALYGQLNDIAQSGRASSASLSGMLRLSQIDTFMRLRALRHTLLKGA